MTRISTIPLCLLLCSLGMAQISSGGQFVLTQAVTANGGNAMQSGSLQLVGTTGQSIAGQNNSYSPFAVHAGFWIPEVLVTTAEHVTVGGSVTTQDGQGIQNVLVTMFDSSGQSRTVRTATFGYFRFDDVEVGRTYIFSVSSKRFEFPQPSFARSVMEGSDDLHFVGVER